MSLSVKAKEKVWLAGALMSPVILLSIFLGFVGYRATKNPLPAPADSSPASLASGILILIGIVALYFLPSIIAHKKRNESAIVTLNLLLGWTVLGWVIALV